MGARGRVFEPKLNHNYQLIPSAEFGFRGGGSGETRWKGVGSSWLAVAGVRERKSPRNGGRKNEENLGCRWKRVEGIEEGRGGARKHFNRSTLARAA